MNIIWAFIFTSIVTSHVLQASQSDAPSDKEKSSTTKNTPSKKSPPKETQPAQKEKQPKEKNDMQKQPSSKEKNPASTATPAQKKLKASAASTAALLKHSKTPGYIAPFEKMEKPAEQKSAPSASVKVQAQNQILQKNSIFQAPLSAKVQNLGNVEIGNSSTKPIEISSIMFSYTFTTANEKDAHIKTRTHRITFPQAHIIPAQKKLAFTISMKNSETLQFAGIKNIQTRAGNLAFDPAITDLSKPIVLNLNKKGKIQYCV